VSRRRKPRSFVWAQAIRDDRDLDRTARLVALVLYTHMGPHDGLAYPGVDLLAAEAALSDRAIQHATRRLEAAGWLTVKWSIGGKSRANQYVATLPETANAVRRSEWQTANGTTPKGEGDALNGEPRSPEDVKTSKKATNGASTSSTPSPPCEECGLGGGRHVAGCSTFKRWSHE
jgi:hypothetical protein